MVDTMKSIETVAELTDISVRTAPKSKKRRLYPKLQKS